MTEAVEPTTPRDAIGLSERLRQMPSSLNDACRTMEEAATALDALQGEISQWANEVARYKAYAEKFDEENAALQARVKELEAEKASLFKSYHLAVTSRLEWRNHATRAEQERDEAYERAAKHFEESEHLVWSNDEAADAIRRLAAGTGDF